MTAIVLEKIPKLKTRAPTTNAIDNTMTMSVRERMYRIPSRNCPFALATLVTGWNSRLRNDITAMAAAAYDAAAMVRVQPEPTVVMATPAIAGPTNLDVLNIIEFIPMAFGMFAVPTNSLTNAIRAGASNA